MKPSVESRLTSFYWGSISDIERLQIEKEILLDPEILVNFLDLKRKLEFATPISQGPSPGVLLSLQNRMQPLRKRIVPVAIGITVAACAMAFALVFLELRAQPSQGYKFLFDSHPELSATSNVL